MKVQHLGDRGSRRHWWAASTPSLHTRLRSEWAASLRALAAWVETWPMWEASPPLSRRFTDISGILQGQAASEI